MMWLSRYRPDGTPTLWFTILRVAVIGPTLGLAAVGFIRIFDTLLGSAGGGGMSSLLGLVLVSWICAVIVVCNH